MDDRVIRAMAKWPDVPSVYGWLSLDCRGRWRLDGGLVRNRATAEAISRNYDRDERGCCYYQNGPQRAYVTLEYTPWVYVLDGERCLFTHTGNRVWVLKSVWLDDEINLLLETEHGVGVVSDVDLDTLTEHFCNADGQILEDERIEAALETPVRGKSSDIFLEWQNSVLPVGRIRRAEVAGRFGFVVKPTE